MKVVLDLDYDEIMSQPNAKEELLKILSELYPGARLVITDIKPGSVVVDFVISGGEDQSGDLSCEEVSNLIYVTKNCYVKSRIIAKPCRCRVGMLCLSRHAFGNFLLHTTTEKI